MSRHLLFQSSSYFVPGKLDPRSKVAGCRSSGPSAISGSWCCNDRAVGLCEAFYALFVDGRVFTVFFIFISNSLVGPLPRIPSVRTMFTRLC